MENVEIYLPRIVYEKLGIKPTTKITNKVTYTFKVDPDEEQIM